MKPTTLKLKPHFEYRVWANNNIKKEFELKEESIGEAWVISAFKQKSSIITNLEKEIELLSFYKDKNNSYFFNDYNLSNEYPLLSKIIDAKDDLSVQIHPDNLYAKQFNSLGKTECWYILDSKKNNSVVLGHNANDIEQFKYMIKNDKWNELLKEVPIKKGDFIYVESTKIHAIKANTLVFELQQSSDITYRVYDYNRLDKGKKRELHLDHVYNLISTPDKTINNIEISNKKDYLVSNELFNLKLIENENENTYFFEEASWIQITVVDGKGKINGLIANKYDSFLVAHKTKIIISGKIHLLLSYIIE